VLIYQLIPRRTAGEEAFWKTGHRETEWQTHGQTRQYGVAQSWAILYFGQ